MFPFKTKKFSLLLEIPVQDFEANLLKYSEKHRFISVKMDGNHQATLSGEKMDMVLSEIPMRNSYRPVIVFEWQNLNNKTSLSGYYRVTKFVLAFDIVFLFIGLIVTVKERSIYPLVFFGLLWSLVFQVLAFLGFRK